LRRFGYHVRTAEGRRAELICDDGYHFNLSINFLTHAKIKYTEL